MINVEKFFSQLTNRLRASEVRELLKWGIKEKVISFGGGFPDPKLYPIREIVEITRNLILKYGHQVLQYGTTEGLDELREELLDFMAKYGIEIPSLDNIMITSGSQQAIDIIGRIFIDPGDAIVVENPTYLAALNAFRLEAPKIYGVPIDSEGIRTDLLEELLIKLKKEGKRVKFLYTVPTAQNPTGITMSMRRRKELMELAEEYDFLIVEDNPYGYIMFEDTKFKHLKAMDNEDRVIHLSTFSKILVPGLRVGWVIADKRIIRKMVIAKQSLDICTSTLSQYLCYELLKRGVVDKQIKILPKYYKQKRDVMLKALEQYMPKGVSWTKPVGGLFIFLKCPKCIDTKVMLKKALEKGVAYVPGYAFYVNGSGRNTMRLNFSYPSREEIKKGVSILAQVIKEELKMKIVAK